MCECSPYSIPPLLNTGSIREKPKQCETCSYSTRTESSTGSRPSKPELPTLSRLSGTTSVHVGNRVPVLEPVEPATVAEGTNVGIFLYPMWRKNVTTQILAARKLGWRPFVMDDAQRWATSHATT